MDRLLESVDRQIAKSEELQKGMELLVGRGEDPDGLVVVEYAGEGLRTLDIRSKAMRLSAAELSERIKATVQAAIEDLQRRTQEFMVETLGVDSAPARMMQNPEALLRPVKRAEASYDRAFESVMADLDRIRRDLDL
ncbi:YbaB/EbfC family nucleoid-associated protein [Nonomuraea antimicrobica]